MSDERIEALLRDARAPAERLAEERGWQTVERAFVELRPERRRHRGRSPVVVVASVLALLAGALSPPGQAFAEWVRDAVRPGRDDARSALASLPAPGRLLVISQRGPWIVERSGSKRLLGAYDDAAWSPQGLFVVVTRGHEVIALEPGGRPRWSLARAGLVRAARWSPDGFRIAYTSGGSLRVVAGDGTGDSRVAGNVSAAPSAWWPGPAHRLAYVDASGRVVVIDTDSRRAVWRSRAGTPATQLAWSSDGTRLLALAPGALRVFDLAGRPVAEVALPAGTRARAAAFRPLRHEIALLSHAASANRSRIELVQLGGGAPISRQRLFAGAGEFGDLAWSPDGRWLLASWAEADQWLFFRPADRPGAAIERLRAVGNIARQFDPGAAGAGRFPALGDWCCSPVGRPK